ncbi:carbamoyltransferase C-terminal domain-containing protein [Solwaraspora sp. WMMD1047]|uniref:carbamoyltransferase family protein n=1 Tax=Solwaraspora sp. WMMD1047 TaxID=3016102 RepID=UPI0024163129|nr:carbamoyltransferase C-terminal domain-containing protein [Solwaraspora sp. WMMD1047]MDG4829263.1 carbamoyltransferase C-terminal domain-containing protein [Solwaraspora sp. WMMD1047]
MIAKRAGRAADVVLGLCAYTHDSAAALLVNGHLIGFAEEERLDGVKHSKAYPANAVAWLLNEAGLTANDVTAVAYNFDGRRYLPALGQLPRHLVRAATRSRAVPRSRSFLTVRRRCQARMQDLNRRFPLARLVPVLHHRAHALYAFLSAGVDDAAVLVVDSLGELQTTTTWHAVHRDEQALDLRLVAAIEDPASLGYAYGAVTEHLGWRRGDEEGTVMALAALGEPARFRRLMCRAIRLTTDGFALDPGLLPIRVLSSRYGRTSPAFTAAACPPRLPDAPVEPVHADLAAALQERTEQVMLHLARRATRLTGSGLLCLGGGVAMNCVAAGRITRAGIVDEVHIPPAPGDSGTAIGAAAAAWLDVTGRPPTGIGGRCYLGPAYPDLAISAEPRPDLAAERPADPVHRLARQLADGAIVGLFAGPLESGPRALGNRSILASPFASEVVDRLNGTVKFRESFRPFAPVILADKAADYVQLRQPSPFMSIAAPVTDLTRTHLPAIVHGNGTARVQTVTRAQHPFLANVLAAFGEITGHPVLINTSLNIKGRPICGTPDMALDCLVETGLDALLIEGWWVTKC